MKRHLSIRIAAVTLALAALVALSAFAGLHPAPVGGACPECRNTPTATACLVCRNTPTPAP